MDSFKSRLRELRIEKGLTQAQLANEAGLRKSTISSWEVGSRTPTADAIIALAKYFNVSTDYLLGVKDWE